jgi:hypothetical protein
MAAMVGLCGAAAYGDSVTKPIKLFNGNDLTNFYTYLQGIGKNKDEKGVFTVKDGAICVSGEIYGCFTTEKEFENYHLVVEFKWGTRTWVSARMADRATRKTANRSGRGWSPSNAR